MKRSRLLRLRYILVFLLVMFAVYFISGLHGIVCKFLMEMESKPLIAKIEAYQQEKHSLPENLDQVGIRQNEYRTIIGVVWYQRVNDSEYELYFPVDFDRSDVYRSSLRKWSERP